MLSRCSNYTFKGTVPIPSLYLIQALKLIPGDMMMIKSHELPFPTQLSFAIPRCFLQNLVFACVYQVGITSYKFNQWNWCVSTYIIILCIYANIIVVKIRVCI